MKKGLVLVVMCVAMLFAAAPSASAQAPSDEYKATLEKMLELSGSMLFGLTLTIKRKLLNRMVFRKEVK